MAYNKGTDETKMGNVEKDFLNKIASKEWQKEINKIYIGECHILREIKWNKIETWKIEWNKLK